MFVFISVLFLGPTLPRSSHGIATQLVHPEQFNILIDLYLLTVSFNKYDKNLFDFM